MRPQRTGITENLITASSSARVARLKTRRRRVPPENAPQEVTASAATTIHSIIPGGGSSSSSACALATVPYARAIHPVAPSGRAQVMELLLPPPGRIEWMVVAGIAVSAWGAFSGGTRRRLVFSLASLALLLAVIKFSVIPVLWERMGPAAGTGFGLGDMAEAVRRTFADYRPLRPVGQLVGVVALALWALGTRLLWPPDDVEVTVAEGDAEPETRLVAAPSPEPLAQPDDRTLVREEVRVREG